MSGISKHLGMTIIDMIRRGTTFRADRPALITETKVFSYQEFDQRSNYLAVWMLQKGGEKGDRVVIWGINTPFVIEVLLACAKNGFIAVPLNTKLSIEEVEFILKDARPTFLFSDRPLPDGWSHIDSIKVKVSFHEDSYSTINYELAIKLAYSLDDVEQCIVYPDDPFLIIYTAEVNGRFKGAVLSQRNMITCNIQTIELLEMNEGDICGIFTPLCQITGLSLLFCALQLGISSVLLPAFDASKALWSIEKYKVSLLHSFSPFAQMILDESSKQGVSIGDYVKGVFGLDSLNVIDSYKKAGVNCYNIYAKTEVAGIVAAHIIEDPAKENSLIGYPGLLSHIMLQNDMGEEVTLGEPGEICIRGETIFSGYWNRADENEWIFRGGWLHTGDLAIRDAEGKLWLKGRKNDKELIKTSGVIVYPAEVEQIIKNHVAVERVYVLGVTDAKLQEAVKAVIQLRNGMRVTEAEIQQFCLNRMAGYKVPKIIQFVDTLPLPKGHEERLMVKKLYG